MQNHCRELSRIQQMNTMLLADDIADQDVSVYISFSVCVCVHGLASL